MGEILESLAIGVTVFILIFMILLIFGYLIVSPKDNNNGRRFITGYVIEAGIIGFICVVLNYTFG